MHRLITRLLGPALALIACFLLSPSFTTVQPQQELSAHLVSAHLQSALWPPPCGFRRSWPPIPR
jgi:hypothetical protein